MKTGTIKFIVYSLILLMVGSFTAYPQSKLLKGVSSASVVKYRTNKGTSSEPVTKDSNTAVSGKKKKLQGNEEQYSSKGYIDILDVEFVNTDKKFAVISEPGSKLYASEVKYLTPNVIYEGLGEFSHEIELHVSVFDAEGKLRKGANSPEGCTYTYKFTEKPGKNEERFSGWGSNKSGSYDPGEYRIEISYQGNVLYSETIRLYSGETPIIDSPILDINNVTYCSTDKKDNKLTEYGADLYEDNLYYLSGNMEYLGKYKNDQSIKLYVRIFNSDGSLVRGSNSPAGFSYSINLTIRQGFNSISTGGYGSAKGGSYSAGNIKLEYWLDGDKIYENWVKVKPKIVNDLGYVDLGLPSGTLWAKCNVGADNPEEPGIYVAWGELSSKSEYTHLNSDYYNISREWLEDNSIIDASGNLTRNHDIASMKLGYRWRMPTVAEMTELDEKCQWTWTSINGVNGFKLTGPNGNSIFLPATGWYNSASDGMLDCVGERSEYWTSSVKEGSDSAHCLFFMKPDTHYSTAGHYVDRSRGLTVRPVFVREKNMPKL